MNQGDYTPEKVKGKHLCLWERKEIEKGLKAGASISGIAMSLGRPKSTISREIRRGSVMQREPKKYQYSKWDGTGYIEKKMYFADTGQRIARENTGRRGGKYKLFEDMGLVRYIEDKILKEKWSPSMALGWLKTQENKFAVSVCFKTVYNYIDRGQLAVKNIDLLLKTRIKPHIKRVRQRKRVLGRSIDERSAEVNGRQEFGHWEGDTVVGKEGKSAVMTLVERKTDKGIILSLKDKSAKSVTAAFQTLKGLPNADKLFKSITFDNGSEFSDCNTLENGTMKIYFAHPYSAWERPVNENYNGMIRRYIPKGRNMNKYSQSDLNRINNQIDSLPRKRHNYKTAQMMFDLELEKLFSQPAG